MKLPVVDGAIALIFMSKSQARLGMMIMIMKSMKVYSFHSCTEISRKFFSSFKAGCSHGMMTTSLIIRTRSLQSLRGEHLNVLVRFLKSISIPIPFFLDFQVCEIIKRAHGCC